jgi:hypothetical protein
MNLTVPKHLKESQRAHNEFDEKFGIARIDCVGATRDLSVGNPPIPDSAKVHCIILIL